MVLRNIQLEGLKIPATGTDPYYLYVTEPSTNAHLLPRASGRMDDAESALSTSYLFPVSITAAINSHMATGVYDCLCLMFASSLHSFSKSVELLNAYYVLAVSHGPLKIGTVPLMGI